MADICPVVSTERILLSTDGSVYSEGAVREAIQLAKKCASAFTAISVIETNPEFESLAPAYLEKQEKEAHALLDQVRKQAAQAGLACETVVREGEDSYQYIIEEARTRKISLIVMGRRGRKGLKRLVMGSTTARVIGHAPCNVLVVPRAAQVKFKNIVVATDGSKHSLAAASEAIGIAKKNGAVLTVLAVVPSEFMPPTDVELAMPQRELIAEQEMKEAEKNARTVKDAARKESVSVQAFVMSGKPAEAIVDTAKEKGADLIVVGSHGRTGLDKLLMGSVAERVIVRTDCAVLVAKGAH